MRMAGPDSEIRDGRPGRGELLGILAVLDLFCLALCPPRQIVTLLTATRRPSLDRTPAPLLGGGGGGAGHLPDRFTRAIAHLGHAEMAIRVGGISDLEQLAQDSEQDHVRIMDVLTAYVRERAPRPAAAPPAAAPPAAAQTLPRDIQAILTVLGRWATTGKNRGTARLDLSNTHLVGAILLAADLSGAKLSGADLSGANLSKAKLLGVSLSRADLSGANLSEAFLFAANLSGASLSGANLSGANLRKAFLFAADLFAADLFAASLRTGPT